MNSTTQTTWDLQYAWPLPGWGMALLFAAAIATVFWLLWRETLSHGQRFALLSLRLFAIVLAFLILGGWKLAFYETERPDLLLVVDRSMSMRLPAGESASDADVDRLQRVQELIVRNRWLNELSDRYHLAVYSIGEDVDPLSDVTKLEALASESRLGTGCFSSISFSSVARRPQWCCWTDGVVTSGRSLSGSGRHFVPARHSVVDGRGGVISHRPEVAIEEVLADDRAFLGDEVRVDVRLKAVSVPQGS
ncbi:MAG: hypothetical protein R3C05_06490 [Pirellulaceae bacterium]